MPSIINPNCTLYLYADDSALSVAGDDLTKIERDLTENMLNVSKWLSQNRLSLHLGKTESILFGSNKKLKNSNPLSIVVDNVRLQETKCVKYLGAHIDDNLSGNTMFTNVINKIKCTMKFLYRNKSFMNFEVRKMLVNSLIQPRFDYACNIWFRCSGKTKQNAKVSE